VRNGCTFKTAGSAQARTWFAAPCVFSRFVTELLTALLRIADAASLPYTLGHELVVSTSHDGSPESFSSERTWMDIMWLALACAAASRSTSPVSTRTEGPLPPELDDTEKSRIEFHSVDSLIPDA
jgi:hypothetical protein